MIFRINVSILQASLYRLFNLLQLINHTGPMAASNTRGIRRIPPSSRLLILARLLFITGWFIIGADAAPFTSRAQLKTAVDNCLQVDAILALENLETPNWDVNQVTDMNSMFQGASAFIADISGWVVSSLTDMSYIFSGEDTGMITLPSWYTGDCPSVFAGAVGEPCTACDAGEYSQYGNPCEKCYAGEFSSPRSANCTRCPLGQSSLAGAATCTPCPAGEITEEAFTSSCSPCLAGESTLGATGAAKCTPRAAGETTEGLRGAASCTTCPKGTWSGKSGQRECIACNQADWCPGGNSCAEGHQREACFECAKDWYMLEDVCYPCKQDAKFFLFVFFGISVFAVFIAAVVFPGKVKAGWKRLQCVKKQAETRVDKLQKKTLGERSSKFGAFVFLVSLITYLQIQMLVVSVSVSWQKCGNCVFRGAGRHHQPRRLGVRQS